MMTSVWVETVLGPEVRRDGAVLEPFTPIELSQPLRLGPEGSGSELEWDEPHVLELRPNPDGVHVLFVRLVGEDRLIKVGGVGEVASLMLRVMSAPHESAGWPAQLARPPAPWTVETRSVLADQFLELGLAVGRRFIDRNHREDDFWFPLSAGMRAQVRWLLGGADRAIVTASPTSKFGRSLARQAVCVPLRQLELRFRVRPDHAAVISGLIEGGGLPCLEQLRLKIEPSDEVRAVDAAPEAISRLRALPGFGAAFPALQTLEVEDEVRSPRPYQPVG